MNPPRHLWPVAIAWLAWLLASCGPGVGGTGTGNGFAFFGATSAQVCSSDLTPALVCTNSGTAVAGPDVPATIEEGTAVVHFADRLPDATVRVAFEANAIELDAPCRSLRFNGDWGISASNDARFFGTYTDAALRDPLPASLQVEALGGEPRNRLSVTMVDGNGRVVLGPITLQRVEVRAPASAC